MKITDAFLAKYTACADGAQWVKTQPDRDGVILVSALIAHNIYWANWLIARMLNKKQRIAYAIYAAEQVIDLYEGKYPGDKRPRSAIDAANAVLKNNNKKTRIAAANAASAAYAAANAAYAAYAAANATYAAANAAAAAYAANAAAAAYAAADAAYAAYAAANATYAAANAAAAAYAANAVDAADAAMRAKIIRYGLKLVGSGK